MNDPVINSRAWDWDTASTAEASCHSHNYVHHTFTNILGKDRDLAYEVMRIDPHQPWNPVYLFQPFYNILLMALFEWGVAVHDLDLAADQRPGDDGCRGRRIRDQGTAESSGPRRAGTAQVPAQSGPVPRGRAALRARAPLVRSRSYAR